MNPPPSKTPAPILIAATACSLLSACAGCGGVRVVTVPTTEPRQLAEPLQAYVYIQTKTGQRLKSANRVQLYEGEWVLSDPGSK